MRGAALKVGQIISLQDEEALGSEVAAIMERVRTQANVMPRWQLEQMLQAELGDDWAARLGGVWRGESEDSESARAASTPVAAAVKNLPSSDGDALPLASGMVGFDEHPVAAASIGQVHRAVLEDGRRVAVKVQYPGVSDSIDSDLDNVTRLLTLGLGSALPPGLYLDTYVRVARSELQLECDYEHEARAQERFRTELTQAAAEEEEETGQASLLAGIRVPAVVPECSGKGVLTTEWLDGTPIDRMFEVAPQETRDSVARRMLRLTLWELAEARLVQSDPNWGNFFYAADTDTLGLLDFGAAIEYPAAFVDDYVRLIWAAAERDEDAIVEVSCRMGFFTGHENTAMVRAHVNSGLVIGEPFASHEAYDFKAARITARVSEHTAVFTKQRLTPPPEEVYSLHRKLVGAYLMCIRMGARFPGRDLLERTVQRHEFTTPPLQGLTAREALDAKMAGTLVDSKALAREEQRLRNEAAVEAGYPAGAVLATRWEAGAASVIGVGLEWVSAKPLQRNRKLTL
jgi:aarF domain-containing kinase